MEVPIIAYIAPVEAVIEMEHLTHPFGAEVAELEVPVGVKALLVAVIAALKPSHTAP